MSIYIALHKQCDLPNLEQYIPIQVGASLHPRLGYLTDDSGDNISEKNASFCELTALYYIWKNTDDTPVGLVHYRRFFYKKKFRSDEKQIVEYQTFCNIVDEKTVVLPQKHYFRRSNYEQYSLLHKKKDMNLCRNAIHDFSPEYDEAFQSVMEQNYIYPYNMFVMTRKNFEHYMEWLFAILFRMEKLCDLSNYDAYNQRIFGFLSERLLNVWIIKKDLKIVSFPVYNNTETIGRHLMEELENGIKKIMR